MQYFHPAETVLNYRDAVFMSLITGLFGRFAKPLELCCPCGNRNEVVDQLRREGLHFGRLR